MKYIVLGCNGMAGHMVSLYLQEKGHKVLGVARQHSKLVESEICDVTNFGELKRIIISNDADAVVNCVGILNQYAEKDKSIAVAVNSYLPHFLSKITENTDTQIVHMSTDCVFSGKKGMYGEDDFRDGETFYDRSKALGELDECKNITLRNSIVGPDIKEQGIGLMNWFLQQGECVKGYKNAIWTGQTTLQLAKTIEFVVENRVAGLYNMVPNESISKYDLLKLFNIYLCEGKKEIIPVDNPRIDKSLIATRERKFEYIIPSYEHMIKELAEWMILHKELYPHYPL